MTMFKCIQVEHGVDISYGGSFFFTFKSKTHNLIDLPEGRVRISRKIDNAIEFVSEPYERFVSLDGQPVGTTYVELSAYMNHDVADLKAGEGVSVTGDTVSIIAGGPSTLGGYKVGTGLVVDGQGRLSANAVSEVTKVLATEVERLALAAEPLRPYRIIQLDTKRLYYLNAGDSPSVTSNWFTGPSIETTVLSFKGRTGVVDSEFGDYNFDLIPMTDKTTNATHKLVIDEGVLYVEDIESTERTRISYSTDIDLSGISTKLTSLDDVVNSVSDGLVKKFSDLTTKTNQIENVVLNASTGLSKRVETLEARPVPTDYGSQITAIQDKNTVQDTRLSAAESSILVKADLVDGKVPYEQLPEFSSGRKVNVANRLARLGLMRYPDLTLAYQSDTGDAWGLDANADPALDANWSKLGNAQGVGVASFNGRTGQIGPMSGDYNSGQITELTSKRFVSETQIAGWDGKETTTGAQTKATAAQSAAIASAKTYADSTFIPVSQKGANNGIAPLNNAGKVPSANLLTNIAGGVPLLDSNALVPIANLPTFLPQSKRIWRDVKAQRTVNTWYINTSPNEREVYVRASLAGAPANRFVSLRIRESTGSTIFIFNSTVLLNVGSSLTYADSNTITVPAGWQFQLSTIGGSTDALTELWYEFY